METTLLTIDFNKSLSSYYFDKTEANRINVYWHEKFIKSFDTLETALIWFIQNKLNDTVKLTNLMY